MSRGVGRGNPHKHHPEERRLHGRCPRCRRNPARRGQLCTQCQPPSLTMERRNGDPTMTDNLIPLAILAAEHGLTINQLAARLGENVLVDDATGLRYCDPRNRAATARAAPRPPGT